MKKYPIEKFYVGKLNIGFKFGNLLVESIKPNLTKKDYEQIDLKNKTIYMGAISLLGIDKLDGFTNWEERIRYDSLFTIFYKLDDNTYICLHNGEKFGLEGINYCSALVPLTSCVPSISSKLNRDITPIEARRIFKILFKDEKKNLYRNTKLGPLAYFYHGKLELYTGNDKEEANTAQRLMLRSKGISPYGGSIDRENRSYSHYDIIAYVPSDNIIYNINDNRWYDSNLENLENSKIKLSSSLAADESYVSINSRNEVTIPQVLKLQRGINNKRY